MFIISSVCVGQVRVGVCVYVCVYVCVCMYVCVGVRMWVCEFVSPLHVAHIKNDFQQTLIHSPLICFGL